MNLIKFFLSIVAIMGGAYLLDGVYVDSFWTALVVAVVIAILNFFLKPLLIILTLPITILTFGIFLLVLNGIVFYLASELVSGFGFSGLGSAIIFSIVYSLLYAALEWATGAKELKRKG